MISRILITLALFCLIAVPTINAQTKNNDKIEKIRQTAITLAADSKAEADVRMRSGTSMKGRINSVETDAFSFTLAKSNSPQTIAFTDVDKLKKHKKGLSTGAWIAIGAGATAAIILTVLFREYYCNEQAC